MAHGGGTFVEIVTPLVLLLSPWKPVTLAAVAVMVLFHLFIISTFPLAVPLEWNVLFGYAAVFLFAGYPGWHGYGLADMSSPWLTLAIVAALLFFPVLGNLRPDLVSFLPSLRQYAGNWASAVWAFAPGAEDKLNAVRRPTANQVDQLVAFGYDRKWADVTMQQVIAWRTMHSQGRGLFSLLLRHLPDIDARTVREGEFVCNSLVGFNFGDGHLHNEDLITAVQAQACFEPGELVVVWVESQPVHRDDQAYKVIDAALGVIERGTWKVADAVAEQPWLPNGPIPVQVTWSRRIAAVPGLPRRIQRAGPTSGRCRHEHRDGSGRRAERARRRGGPRRRGRAGHRAGGGRRGRRRRALRRVAGARPAARPLLGVPPDGGRLAVPEQPRPGPVRAVLAVGRRSTARTRSTAGMPGCCTARSRRPPPVLAATGPDGGCAFGRPSAEYDKLAGDIMRPLLRAPRHPLALARFGLPTLLPGSAFARVLATEKGRALFGGVAAHAFRPLHYPLTSAIGAGIITAGHRWGWPVAAGGSGSITAALAALLADLGGKIETGSPIRAAAAAAGRGRDPVRPGAGCGRRRAGRQAARTRRAGIPPLPARAGRVQGRLRG